MASVASMPSPSATCAALVGLLGSRTGTSGPSGPSHLSSVARGAWRLDMAEHGGRGRWTRRSKTMAPLGAGAIGAVVGAAGPGPAIAATALAGIAACIAFTTPGRGRGLGMGANLGNAIWWPLVFLLLWALPLGALAGPP